MLTAVLVVLAACDTQTPLVPEPEGEAITVLQALKDTSLYAQDASIEIVLDAHFRQVLGPALRYTVSSEGTAAAIRTSGERSERLIIDPQHVGSTRIDVKMEDTRANVRRHTFAVQVRDDCPWQPPDGAPSYFPLDVGQVTRYEYSWLLASYSSIRISGILTWTVVGAGACTRGQQVFTVEETLDAERHRTNLDGTESREDLDRRRTLTFAVHDSLVYLGPYFDQPLRRFQASTEPDTLDFHADDPRSIYARESGHGWRARVRLVRNRGLIARSFFYHGGVVHDEYENLVLIEDEE